MHSAASLYRAWNMAEPHRRRLLLIDENLSTRSMGQGIGRLGANLINFVISSDSLPGSLEATLRLRRISHLEVKSSQIHSNKDDLRGQNECS